MSVILDALRTEKEQKEKAKPHAREGLVWGEASFSMERQASPNTIIWLGSILIVIVIISLGLWFYSRTESREQLATTPVPSMAAAPAQVKLPENLINARALEVMLKKAETHFNAGEYDQSLKLYEEILLKDSKNYLVHNGIGLNFLKKNMLDKSQEHLNLAISLNADCVECLNNLGYLKTVTGDALEAERLLKRASELKNDYPEPYFNLAVLYEKNGDKGSAVDAYKAFLHHFKDKKSPIFIRVQNHLQALMVQ